MYVGNRPILIIEKKVVNLLISNNQSSLDSVVLWKYYTGNTFGSHKQEIHSEVYSCVHVQFWL